MLICSMHEHKTSMLSLVTPLRSVGKSLNCIYESHYCSSTIYFLPTGDSEKSPVTYSDKISFSSLQIPVLKNKQAKTTTKKKNEVCVRCAHMLVDTEIFQKQALDKTLKFHIFANTV